MIFLLHSYRRTESASLCRLGKGGFTLPDSIRYNANEIQCRRVIDFGPADSFRRPRIMRAASARRSTSSSNVQTCLVCANTGTQKCNECIEIGATYCSTECQKKDWKLHKTLCKTAKSFTDDSAPGPAMRRAIIFDAEEEVPRFIWVDEQEGKINASPLGVGANELVGRRVIEDSKIPGRPLADYPILLYNANFKDKPVNESVLRVVSIKRKENPPSPKQWQGHLLFAVQNGSQLPHLRIPTYRNITFEDYRNIVDHLANIRPISGMGIEIPPIPRPVNLASTGPIQGVQVRLNSANTISPFAPRTFEPSHSFVESQTRNIQTYKSHCCIDLVYHISNTSSALLPPTPVPCNPRQALHLLFPLSPPSSSSPASHFPAQMTISIARADHKPLVPGHMEFLLINFVSNSLADGILQPLDDSDMEAVRFGIVRDRASPRIGWREVMGVWEESKGWHGEVESPFLL